MSLQFKSFLKEVEKAFEESKGEVCQAWGELIIPEAQLRTPVLSGDLRRSETFEILPENTGVTVGSPLPYACAVELGNSHHPNPVPFLEDAVMDNITELQDIIIEKMSAHMGGK